MVRCGAVAILGGDVTVQDALNGAAVELFEDLRNHAKSFQSPEGEKGFVGPSSRLSWYIPTWVIER